MTFTLIGIFAVSMLLGLYLGFTANEYMHHELDGLEDKVDRIRDKQKGIEPSTFDFIMYDDNQYEIKQLNQN